MRGIHMRPRTTIRIVLMRPTRMMVRGGELGRNLSQTSIVMIVAAELKVEARLDINAAEMHATMRPSKPGGRSSATRVGYAALGLSRSKIFAAICGK